MYTNFFEINIFFLQFSYKVRIHEHNKSYCHKDNFRNLYFLTIRHSARLASQLQNPSYLITPGKLKYLELLGRYFKSISNSTPRNSLRISISPLETKLWFLILIKLPANDDNSIANCFQSSNEYQWRFRRFKLQTNSIETSIHFLINLGQFYSKTSK